MAQKSLEEVLAEYFNPKKDAPKGVDKYVIAVNGTVLTTTVKNKKALEKTLRAIAIEDARTGDTTKVVVYKLEGEMSAQFETTIATKNDTPTEEN